MPTKYNIEDMAKIAAKRGGKCLSKRYVNANSKLIWQCEHEHIWNATPAKIMLGRWCPECNKIKKIERLTVNKYKIEDLRRVASARKGKLLSTQYENNNVPLLWECENKHTFAMKTIYVMQGSWCNECRVGLLGNNIKHTIDEMRNLANARNGQCLSNEYINNKSSLLWKCNICEYEWSARADSIIKGKWCPKCSNNLQRSIEEMKQIAIERGGRCLSDKYLINNKTKLKWQCADGHIWMSTPHNVAVDKSWCPKCNINTSEEKCRFIFENIFNKKFPNTRYILNGLELDGYNDELKLAFEYNGEHHYIKNIRGQSTSKFEKIIKNDINKRNKCEVLGIKLIVIPYYNNTGNDELINFIINELIRIEALKSEEVSRINIDFTLFSAFKNKILELQSIAKRKGGRLLSAVYLGSKEDLEFECEKGHRFFARPNSIISSGSWCSICNRQKRIDRLTSNRKTIEFLKEFARKNKCELLSTAYNTSRQLLKWKCLKCDIQFEDSYAAMQRRIHKCLNCRKTPKA